MRTQELIDILKLELENTKTVGMSHGLKVHLRKLYDEEINRQKDEYNHVVIKGSKLLKKLKSEPHSIEVQKAIFRADFLVNRSIENLKILSDLHKPFKLPKKKK